jgi:class 3 adenylate cyclase
LVGSTALSEQLDPEELRDVVRAYQRMCHAIVMSFEGHVAQYLGDGLLVYFGYPLAHEDGAQRAVRAGLKILSNLPLLNAQLGETIPAVRERPLQTRVGIHTGLVVVGEMGIGDGREPIAAVGETPNIAARLQAVASPDTVVVSAATQRLTEGLFDFLDLGARPLRGISTPLPLYHVTRERSTRSRLDVASARGLTPLVGRAHELGVLAELWEMAKEGTGQVLLLRGEPGIGKSRMVGAIRERITQEPHRVLECQCSSYHRNSALYPVIELLQRASGWGNEDSPAQKLTKLEAMLAACGACLREVVPLFAALLSLPQNQYPPLMMAPQRQRRVTLEALLALLESLSNQEALLFVIEDLHWCDPSTLEFISMLVEQRRSARILTVLTCRPGFHPAWGSHSHVT